MTVPVRVRRLPHNQDLPLPVYATEGAAGMDLLAAVFEPVVIAPGQRVLIPTGLAIALPPGYELQVRPRSGLALRNGIVLPNSPGTIDEDYRGEIQVIVLNTGSEPFRVERGARIAQAVLAPVVRAAWDEVADLDVTARNEGGFGSTGPRILPRVVELHSALTIDFASTLPRRGPAPDRAIALRHMLNADGRRARAMTQWDDVCCQAWYQLNDRPPLSATVCPVM